MLTLNAYNNALIIEPKEPNLLLSRCALLVKLGLSLDKALEAIEKSLEIDQTNVDSWYYKGLILYRKEETDKAFHAFKEANKLDPVDVQVLIYMGLLAGKLGSIEEGRKFCEIAKKVDPVYTERLLQGLIGLVKGDVEQAELGFGGARDRFFEKREEKKELE